MLRFLCLHSMWYLFLARKSCSWEWWLGFALYRVCRFSFGFSFWFWAGASMAISLLPGRPLIRVRVTFGCMQLCYCWFHCSCNLQQNHVFSNPYHAKFSRKSPVQRQESQKRDAEKTIYLLPSDHIKHASNSCVWDIHQEDGWLYNEWMYID